MRKLSDESVVCAIIVCNRKFLATQNRADSDHPFQWEFAGGKIKNGETAERAICREIMEELELIINVQQQMHSVNFDYGFKQIELIPFLCSIKKGKIKLNNHHAFRWITVDEFDKINFSGADKELIQHPGNLAILKKAIDRNS